MLATHAPPRARLERGVAPRWSPVYVPWGWAPREAARQDASDADGSDPNAPGTSLGERERRWACEWWPPD
jgi:hypothetical protein